MLYVLGGDDWFGILVDDAGVLWLAPIEDKYAAMGIEAISAKRAFERQYGSLPSGCSGKNKPSEPN